VQGPGKPFLIVEPGTLPSATRAWLALVVGLDVLNVAGNRGSVQPGIGDRAERWLTALFLLVVEGRPSG
jgi:hypothetical protein